MGYCSRKEGEGYHDTFAEFLRRMLSDKYHVPVEYYVYHLRYTLSVIPRDRLFIMSFEALTNEHTQVDTLNRLLFFLGFPPEFPRRSDSPNNSTQDRRRNDLKPVFCADVRLAKDTFSKANIGLAELINSDSTRPISEPMFLPFEEQIECIE
jgi:hypothetical protein